MKRFKLNSELLILGEVTSWFTRHKLARYLIAGLAEAMNLNVK